MWGVGGCFDICCETNAPPIMSISASDIASDTQLSLGFGHHFAVSTVVGVSSFHPERDTFLSFDKLDPETRHI